MTREEAIQFYRDEIQYLKAAPRVNGCEMKDYWQRQIDIHTMAINALMADCNQQGDYIHCFDEVCVHPDCIMRGDFCPVADYPGVCRFEDRRGEDG